MSVPLFATQRQARATTDVVVEIAPSQTPPRMPLELRDYVSPNTWESRMSLLTRLASQYCRPTFERAYLMAVVLLTFFVPVLSYFVILHGLVKTTDSNSDDFERQIWWARFATVAITIATWLLLIVPVIIWKYTGRVRFTKLADQWTRTDALSARTYGASPVWKMTVPGMIRSLIVLEITVPTTIRSNFDPESYLPPYIAAGEDGLPAYTDTKTTPWSKDFSGRVKYGELPIYTDKLTV